MYGPVPLPAVTFAANAMFWDSVWLRPAVLIDPLFMDTAGLALSLLPRYWNRTIFSH
jgi:hypothetical protein